VLLRDAHQRNLFSADTLSMIEGALQVSEMHARDVMIPRGHMVVLPYEARLDKLLDIVVDSGHSRFPVVGGSRDDVLGILLAKDLLAFYAKGGTPQAFSIRDMMRPVIRVPESKRLNILLREFRTSRNHMAVVVDEYGGVAGLVTIEDLIEEIVGDIDDEHDIEQAVYIKPRKEGHTVHALIPIEEFNAYFKTDFSDEEFDTIGGMILKTLGHLPKRGEKCAVNGLVFEVMRADRRRIQLLRVRPDTGEDLSAEPDSRDENNEDHDTQSV
jgi:magnesium and cobalt transporter